MANQKLTVSSSPHVRTKSSVSNIMNTVSLSLVPAAALAVYFFGFYAFLLIATCIVSSVLAEVVWQKARDKKITINDGSAILTGLLLALTLPPRLPLWMAALGSVVAIIIGKQVFGGLGFNPFNPALVGRAFLVAAFSVKMTTWYAPHSGVDATTTATPLALMKMSGEATNYWSMFMGNIGGSLGETSALAILLGGAYLIYKGIVDYRITLGFLGTVALMTGVFGQDPIFHLLGGGLMIGGFYMLTDMVTSPITKKGRWIYGIGAGIILVIIRLWGGYSEGVLYAILLINMTVPIINRYTRPRTYGEVKGQ